MTTTTHHMALVTISGAQGHGKTTLASALADSIAPGLAVRPSFAGPIRDMLRAMGVEDFEDKTTPRPELCGQTLRHAMQTLGDWGRGHLGQTVWVDHLITSLDAARRAGAALAIVDDVRYHNEDGALRGWADAHILPLLHVRVSRHPQEQIPVDPHPSEADWPRFHTGLRVYRQDGDPAAWVKLALRELENRGWYPPDAFTPEEDMEEMLRMGEMLGLEGRLDANLSEQVEAEIVRMGEEGHLDALRASSEAQTPIIRCARCGGDHYAPLPFAKLDRPCGTFTHWAHCPSNGQPIMLEVNPG